MKTVTPENMLSNMWDQNDLPMEKLRNAENFFEALTEEFLFSIDGIAKHRPQEEIKKSIDWIKQRYPDVKCSEISNLVSSNVVVDGLSLNHLQSSIYRSNITKYLKNQDCNLILEIGAGYGALARELILAYPNVKYIIVDLEDVLSFSHRFLLEEFPDKKHTFLKDSQDLLNFDILYVSAQNIDSHNLLKEISGYDLCVNTCSFAEMTSQIVEYYMNLVQELGVKYFYWFNRFNHRVSPQGECILQIPSKTNITHFDAYPEFLKCPGNIMKEHGQNCEIFMECNTEQSTTKDAFIILYKKYMQTKSLVDAEALELVCRKNDFGNFLRRLDMKAARTRARAAFRRHPHRIKEFKNEKN